MINHSASFQSKKRKRGARADGDDSDKENGSDKDGKPRRKRSRPSQASVLQTIESQQEAQAKADKEFLIRIDRMTDLEAQRAKREEEAATNQNNNFKDLVSVLRSFKDPVA
jgi:hypothetical protein